MDEDFYISEDEFLLENGDVIVTRSEKIFLNRTSQTGYGPSTSKSSRAMQNEGKGLEYNNRIDETSDTRQITEQPYNPNIQY